MEDLVKKKTLLQHEKSDFDYFIEQEKKKLDKQTKKAKLELASEKLKFKMDLDKHNRDFNIEKLKFEEAKRVFYDNKEKERARVREILTKQISDKMEAKLKDRESEIRAQLKAEYDLMLKGKLQERDEALKKKKFQLELELQQKMKEALNS